MDDDWVRVPDGYKRVSDGKVVRTEPGLAIWGMDTDVSGEEWEVLKRWAARDREIDEHGEPQMDAE